MSGKNRDDFLEKTKRKLEKRVASRCSNPDCRRPTSGPHTDKDQAINIGVAAHITAAASNAARYDDTMTPEQRMNIENGIWLCRACGTLIDSDVVKYSVAKLHEWKEQAEAKADKGISSIEQVYPDCSIPKFLTDSPSKIKEKQFLFRDEKVAELIQQIRNEENLLLVSGFGGIGKTAIARSLYHHFKEDYTHIAWISYQGSIRESFLSQVKLFQEKENQDTRWEQIKNSFRACKRDLLLFVDNLPQSIESDASFEWLLGIDARLVATSRLSKVRNFTTYEIDFLSEEQGIEVFYCYYDYDKEHAHKEIVKQLVELVSCHTLSIEL